MRRDLGLYCRFTDDWHPPLDWYIPGEEILTWVKAAASGLAGKGTQPSKSGLDQANAWELNDYADWLGAWQELMTNAGLKTQTLYFKAGGRIIRKAAHPDGDGYYVADHALAGTDSTKGQIWNRRDGASYREYGRFLDNRFAASGRNGPLAHAAWSVEMARKLRKVLRGEVNYATKQGDEVEAALPSLACAMFLSEPARNKREFIIGLMMLDLIGDTYSATDSAKKYTLTKVFVHPERLPTGPGRGAPAKDQAGPENKRWRPTGPRGNTVWVEQNQRIGNLPKEKLAMVEGKYPASPSGSARTSDNIDVAGDYIQQKEVSIATRWVAKVLEEYYGGYVVTVSALKTGQSAGKTKIVPSSGVPAIKPDIISKKFLQSGAQGFVDEVKNVIRLRGLSFV